MCKPKQDLERLQLAAKLRHSLKQVGLDFSKPGEDLTGVTVLVFKRPDHLPRLERKEKPKPVAQVVKMKSFKKKKTKKEINWEKIKYWASKR